MSYPDVRFAGGPTYASGVNTLLFPFSYSSGTLELPSTFQNGLPFVSPTGVPPGNAGVFIRRLGGNSPVTRLGPNLVNYIRKTLWVDGANTYKISATTAVSIVANGIVTKVQQLGLGNLPPSINSASYKVSTNVPANFIQHASSFLFDAPLIVSAGTAADSPNRPNTLVYITFYTQWDH